MHSGLARLRDALHGFIAHQARPSNPEASQPPCAGCGGDFVATLVAGIFGRAARWRSRGALLAADGATAAVTLARLGAGDRADGVVRAPAADACCPSGLTHIATGSASELLRGARDGADGGSGVGSRTRAVGAVAGSVAGGADDSFGDGAGAPVDDGAGNAAPREVATRIAGAEPTVADEARGAGNDGRLKVHAPHANATTPRNASASAALM